MGSATAHGAHIFWLLASVRILLSSRCCNEAVRYAIPHIQDFSARVCRATIFSKVDLVRGYHQVPVAPENIAKTAVITPFGLFEFLLMPFGLKKAAQTFQPLMDNVYQPFDFCFCIWTIF